MTNQINVEASPIFLKNIRTLRKQIDATEIRDIIAKYQQDS